MAPEDSQTADERLPRHIWPSTWGPAPHARDVLGHIEDFLSDLKYTDSAKALRKEAKKHGIELQSSNGTACVAETSLMGIWRSGAASQKSQQVNGVSAQEETSDDSSSEDSSSESEAEAPSKSGQKRKREATPSSSEGDSSESESGEDVKMGATAEESSSDSDSDSSSDSSDEERPLQKRKKLSHIEAKSSTDASSSEESSDSESDASAKSGSSSSVSDSSSESDSSEDTSSDSSDSDSSEDTSSDSSDSDSDSDDQKAPARKLSTAQTKKEQKPTADKLKALEPPKADRAKRGSATSSSATLAEEGTTANQATDTLLIPASADGTTGAQLPATKENLKKLKKDNVPFSRIPANQTIDPRFATNAYVPYDYADRAYQDLVVTKGKGFTKEKNKKKRGAYRGGAIDLTPKGIKFDD